MYNNHRIFVQLTMDIIREFQFEEGITTLFDEVKSGVLETLPCTEPENRQRILFLLTVMQEVRDLMKQQKSYEFMKEYPNSDSKTRNDKE